VATPIRATSVADMVQEVLTDQLDAVDVIQEGKVTPLRDVQSWGEAGVLSRDAGFRLELANGQVFDLTITEGRR
jgi:hypothetical protein